MKIGIDCRLWNETGVGRYIRNLVKYLGEIDTRNNYVLFVKSSDMLIVKDEIVDNKWKMEDGKWKIVPADVHWHSVQEQVLFPQILYKENLDLMHFPYFSLPILYRRPFVITVHDLIIHHFPTGKASTLPLPLYKMKHLGYKAVLQRAVRKAERILVPLEATKSDLVKSLKVPEEKIAVTYEGIDSALTTNLTLPSPKRRGNNSQLSILNSQFFLYVGNAYPHKNLEILIGGFRKLFGTHPHPLFKREGESAMQLVLVGKEDYFYKKLEERLREEKIYTIKILHNVDDGMLQSLYKNALAVVAPSLMEGFGLVPLEAMANECLVIASNIPAHREVCGEAAVYFDPRNVESLVGVMEEVCYHDSNHSNKVKLGKERVKSFSWERMTEQTLRIYESSKLDHYSDV